MQSVKVKIRGIAPMLQNRYPMEAESEETAKRRDEKFDPKEDAEKALYRNKDGCFVPSSWIEAALRDTAKEFKGKGRASLKGTILSSVFVEPEEIPLGKKTYDEIDRRPAVIQRQRIVKSRPRFNSWAIEFTINFDEERVKKEVLKEVLIEAGKSKGIGDYRPKFGRFEVVKFDKA
jgi:hypothetical protein